MRQRALPLPLINAGWVAVAAAVGTIGGLVAGEGQIGRPLLVVVPLAMIVLLLRSEWIAPLLVTTVFVQTLTVGNYNLSRIAGPVALAMALLTLQLDRRREPLPRTALVPAIAAYGLWAVSSMVWAQTAGTKTALGALALSFAYMLTLVLLVRERSDLERVAGAFWWAAVASAVVALAQYAAGAERSVGYAGDANFFATMQVVALPIGAVIAAQTRHRLLRAATLIGLALVVGSILTSLSRGGLLAWGGVFVLLLVQPSRAFFSTPGRKFAIVSLAVIGAAALAALSYDALSARTGTLFQGAEGGSGRANLWRAAVTGWHQHELHGIGFGTFRGVSNDLLRATSGVDLSGYQLRPHGQYVHNAYLESLTELGLIGLALFLALVGSAWRTLRAAVRAADRAGQAYLAAMGRALVVAGAGLAFTSFFLSTETARILWVLIGLAIALPRVVSLETQRNPPGTLLASRHVAPRSEPGAEGASP
jgi:O-antigen ligase